MHKLFDKKTGSRANVNEVLAQELRKPVTKKIRRKKVYARFKDNIWGSDLSEMGSLSSFNHGVKYLLFVIDVSTKYACVKVLEDKKTKEVLHGFIENVTRSKRKPNKLWLFKEENFPINLYKNG